MSGTYPTSPSFASLGFGSEQKTKVSTTDSGKQFTAQVDGQRWKFKASYPPMRRSDFAPIYAFIIKQRSQKETFQIVLPEISTLKGTVSSIVATKVAATAGSTSISLKNVTGTFKAGDLIKFNSHSKIYMIVADATGDGSSEATITIEPPVRQALLADDTVIYTNVPFTARLTSDLQEFNTSELDLYRFEVDFIEAV